MKKSKMKLGQVVFHKSSLDDCPLVVVSLDHEDENLVECSYFNKITGNFVDQHFEVPSLKSP